ncbi:MAG: HEPN domain-containing protein [Chlorobiaceae bacterium]
MSLIEERGVFYWSHDTSKEREVSGLLKINDNGNIFLFLDEFFYPDKQMPKTIVVDKEGISFEDKFIFGTLNKTNQVIYLSGLRVFGLFFENFQASDCLIGFDFDHDGFSEELINPSCKQLNIPLEGFENWLCWNPIEYNKNDKEITISYKVPDDDIYLIDNAEIRLTYDPNLSYGQTASLNPSANFIYTPNTPSTLKSISDIFRSLQDLLILLTNSEYCIKWPILTLSHNDRKYSYYFLRYTNNTKKPERHEAPIYFDHIKSNFGEIFASWKQKSDWLGSAFYSFLGTKRGIMLYIEDHFKILVGGLEAYHRKTVETPPIPEKLQKKINRILGNIRLNKDKKWLEHHVIKHAHISEPRLSDRLFRIIKDVQPNLDDKKVKCFSESCASIRNDLSHYAGQRKANDNTSFYQELVKTNEALSYLYHALILINIGINEQLIEKWFNNSHYSYRIKKALANAKLIDKPSEIK